MSSPPLSVFHQAISVDDTLPLDEETMALWMNDMQTPLRGAVLPALRLFFSLVLFSTYFLKRLLPFQFRAHTLLQWLICWFMKYFVRPEANVLILRHYGTESNVLNFLIDNSGRDDLTPVDLYPMMIRDMMDASFVDHDQELFRAIRDLGPVDDKPWPIPRDQLNWTNWRPVGVDYNLEHRKFTQILDFETSHVLFMTLFCFLLTADEYEAAINGFQLDQSIAIRIAKMLDEPTWVEMAYNKFPLYMVSPWNLTQRFFLHGLFTEYMYAALERVRQEQAA